MRPTIPKTNSGRTGLLSGKAPDLFDKYLIRISAGVPATLIDSIWWFSQILQENTGILSWSSHERFLPNSFQDMIHWLFIPRYFPDALRLNNSRKCVRWRSNVPFCDRCVKNCIIYIKRYLNGQRRKFARCFNFNLGTCQLKTPLYTIQHYMTPCYTSRSRRFANVNIKSCVISLSK